MRNNVLIILGMHRSGTSLTAQWLQRCGINLGKRFMPGSGPNKDGYFEDLDFCDLHEDIFRQHGVKQAGLEDIENFRLNKNDIQRMEKLVIRKNCDNLQWGWKDPRTCLFIDEYIKLLPSVKVLVVLRDVEKIISSLIKREIAYRSFCLRNTGRLGRLRVVKYNLFSVENEKRRYGKIFTSACIVYYKKILSALKSIDQENFAVVDLLSNEKNELTILDQLRRWGFDVPHPISLSDVVKPHYLTAPSLCPYITNREILIGLQQEISRI